MTVQYIYRHNHHIGDQLDLDTIIIKKYEKSSWSIGTITIIMGGHVGLGTTTIWKVTEMVSDFQHFAGQTVYAQPPYGRSAEFIYVQPPYGRSLMHKIVSDFHHLGDQVGLHTTIIWVVRLVST